MSDIELIDKARIHFQDAAERDPLQSQYGILTIDASLGVYKQSCFLWFYDAQSLSNFFTYSYPYMCCAIDEDDEDLISEIKDLAKSIIKIPPDDRILNELANFSGELISLVWWGSFNDLCYSNSETAKKIRIDFRKQRVNETLASGTKSKTDLSASQPIQEDEVIMFVEFLANLKNE